MDENHWVSGVISPYENRSYWPPRYPTSLGGPTLLVAVLISCSRVLRSFFWPTRTDPWPETPIERCFRWKDFFRINLFRWYLPLKKCGCLDVFFLSLQECITSCILIHPPLGTVGVVWYICFLLFISSRKCCSYITMSLRGGFQNYIFCQRPFSPLEVFITNPY